MPKTIFLTKSKCKSLQKYKIGIYIKFHAGCSNHLRGKPENLLGGAESAPPHVTRVKGIVMKKITFLGEETLFSLVQRCPNLERVGNLAR